MFYQILGPVWAFFLIVSLFFGQLSWGQVSRNFQANEKPFYELGVGVVTLDTPDYPGSANNEFRALPFPWAVYRGEFIRIDDEGSRARIKSGRNYEFGFSGGFNFPVESEDNPARVGMPDLDALIGFGPSLILRLLTEDNSHQFNFSLGLRGNVSTNFGSRFEAEGFVLEPLWFYWKKIGKKRNTTLLTAVALTFADKGYNNFFYGIEPQFANAQRSAFDAKAGLNQAYFLLGLTHIFREKYQIFAGAFHGNLELAANKDSALIEEKRNFGFALGFVWFFHESEKKVNPHKEFFLIDKLKTQPPAN